MGTLSCWYIEKNTHTDQYLDFTSHHPLQHKLSMVRTLLTRCARIVTDEDDRRLEEQHIKKALSRCGYPEWCIRKVKEQMMCSELNKFNNKGTKEVTRNRQNQSSCDPVGLCTRSVGSSRASLQTLWSINGHATIPDNSQSRRPPER